METMQKFRSFFFVAFAITVSIILSPLLLTLVEANRLGFTVDLIHRDSPASPLFNSSLSDFERLSNAIRLSHSRVKYFTLASKSPRSASTKLVPDSGSYLMKIKLGTPSFNVMAIADTGSDLIWTQCSPCKDCYRQKAPLFNPKASSTYREVSCSSEPCASLAQSSCYGNGSCGYSVLYGDMSYSRGALATETLTLGNSQQAKLPGTIFGCGFDNGGTFSEDGSGIIGLGGGMVSLVSQLRSSNGGKFSYCLSPNLSNNTKPGKIHFGHNADVSGSEVVTTPMAPKSPKTFYFLTLEGFSVGQQRLEFYNSSSLPPNTSGNIIIDSGTTLTYIPSGFYSRLESAIKSAVGLQTVQDPLGQLSLCYRVSKNTTLPVITAHFTGANVKLNPLNTFIRTSDDVECLAFAPSPSGSIAIFGNVAQMNFWVGYDLIKKTVSFKHVKC